jgi:transcription elongation GreA/GreB family factor
MSRAFTREDSPKDDEPPERPVSSRPNYVTANGLALLETTLKGLAQERSALLGRSDDPELRRKRLLVERDIAYYRKRLETAILVDHRNKEFPDIRFGAVIEAADASDKRHRFEIVGEDEADPKAGKLNWASPLADALLGKKAGDKVPWTSEDGPATLTILSVRFP